MRILKKIFIVIGVSSGCLLSASSFPDAAVLVKTDVQFNELTFIKNSALDYLATTSKAERVTRFIFIRHGESKSNKEKSMAGRTLDTDLSDQGVAQALDVGLQLNSIDISIDAAFSSPTKRTTKTAGCFLSMINGCETLVLQQDERLHERWYGPYEGASETSYAPIKNKEDAEVPLLPSFAAKFEYRPHPEMESMQDVYLRTVDFILDTSKLHLGKTIVVATHNAVMKALIMADAAFNGFDVEYKSFDLGNCSIIAVDINPQNEIIVKASKGLKYRTKLSK